MAVVPNDWPDRYGGVVTRLARDDVTGSCRADSPAALYHFVGVQMAHPSVFARVADRRAGGKLGGVYRR